MVGGDAVLLQANRIKRRNRVQTDPSPVEGIGSVRGPSAEIRAKLKHRLRIVARYSWMIEFYRVLVVRSDWLGNPRRRHSYRLFQSR